MLTRAGVPESVFYDFFASVEDCYCAAYEQGLDRLSRAVADAVGREHGWLERVRAGLVALLGFFDDEPAWARLLLLDTPAGGGLTLDSRPQLHDVLGRLLDTNDGADEADGQPSLGSSLTDELTVGGVLSVIRTSMLEDDARRLVELAPSLISFVAIQYGHPHATSEPARSSQRARPREIIRTAELPIRATHRTTMVLRSIEQTPYSNNREIAQAAGLVDEGQTSKLLTRLERTGLIENVGIGAARGEPNAWLLTGPGRRAVRLLGDSFNSRARGMRMRSGGVA